MNDTSLFQTDGDIVEAGYSEIHADETANFVYRESTQQLFMFQEDTKYILVCDVQIADGECTMSDWKKYEKELPVRAYMSTHSDFTLGFDKIIFWFDFSSVNIKNWRIWCLDLDNNDKWYECDETIPYVVDEDGDPEESDIIKDKDDNVHLISFDEGVSHHFRASFYDLLPLEIIKLNKHVLINDN